MELRESEKILIRKAVNVRRRFEYAGGWLTLTNQRLVIQPHRINLDSSPIELNLSDIAGTEAFNTLGLVPNGLRILRKQGDPVQVVVWGRRSLSALLRAAVEAKAS